MFLIKSFSLFSLITVTIANNCPKLTDSCYLNGKKFFFSDSDIPRYWVQKGSTWYCHHKEGGKCKIKNEVDVYKCKNSPVPIPKPSCPKPMDSCRFGYSGFYARSPYAPPCWVKEGNDMMCYPKQNNTCNPNQLDITTCNVTAPIIPPACPKKDNMCLYGDIAFKATDPNAPSCWANDYGKYLCFDKKNGKCNVSNGEQDISACDFNPPSKPKPSCPKPMDSCRFGYSGFYARSPYAPPCWVKEGNDMMCYPKQNGVCNSSQLDITTCNVTAPIIPPACPKKDNMCLYGDIAFKATDSNAPLCWANDYGKYLCFDKKDGKCNISNGEQDISTCKLNNTL